MPHHTSDGSKPSSPVYETLEAWVRTNIQGMLQSVLEEELKQFLGRETYSRDQSPDGRPGRRAILESGVWQGKKGSVPYWY